MITGVISSTCCCRAPYASQVLTNLTDLICDSIPYYYDILLACQRIQRMQRIERLFTLLVKFLTTSFLFAQLHIFFRALRGR